MLNRIFVLLDMLSQYLATAIIRGIFTTLSNITVLFAAIANTF